jgi:hypothetical protein
MYDLGEELAPIQFSAYESLRAFNASKPLASFAAVPLRLVRLDRRLVGLQYGDLFICAESDGRITLSRSVCSLGECFVPSEDWCTEPASPHDTQVNRAAKVNWQGVQVFRPSARGPSAAQTGSDTAKAEPRLARRRVVVIHHLGNVANRMLQYMSALTLANRIDGCTIVNVSLPEWGIEIPDDTQNELFSENVELGEWDPFKLHIESLCRVANQSDSIRILVADYLQRMEFFMHPQLYRKVFAQPSNVSEKLTEKHLLINIRAAEVLNGVPHYPLLPVAFYEDVVARTGLEPVFVGQLTPSRYVDLLRERFPQARFIDSQGPRSDFDLIRSAKNIVVAISTFSWLAAWLSDAETIILPLSGLFNPAHLRECDLLPIDDIRYRYFLFPLNFGLPEKDSLQYHERIKGRWKEISNRQVALLKTAAPFLRVPRVNYENGLPARFARGSGITFDSVWYTHEYIDAAMEISEGWFEDPLHHYLEIGRLRGYHPTRP